MHRVFLFHERGVKGSSRCSVAAMATFCLLSACKDAPLVQRQGRGVPSPPSLPLDSTHPATGQGLLALDNPKEEVEAQKS